MHRLILPIVLAAFALGGWFLASPWLAMRDLAEAAQTRNIAELEAAIDFPTLRDNMRAGAKEQFAVAGEDRGSKLASAILERMTDGVVDAAITPEGVATIVASGAVVAGLVPERLRGQEVSWGVEYEGLSRFRGIGTFEDGSAGPVLYFERRGMRWQLVDISVTQ